MKSAFEGAYATIQVSGHRAELIVARDELRRAEHAVHLAPSSQSARHRLQLARAEVERLAATTVQPTPAARC